MKKISKTILICFVFAFLSCKKDTSIDIIPLATLNMANAVIDGKVSRLNNYLRDSCSIMGVKSFTIKAGGNVQLRAFASSTPNLPYFDQSKAMENGGIYSLFLTGTASLPEAIFVKDNIPPYPTAEVINIRLVNLSPTSGSLTLTVGTAPLTPVISNIAYKEISEFITMPFPMTLPANANLFQIRDNIGNLLLTYTMPASGTVSQASSRRRNLTFVVKGISGGTGTNAFGIFPMPNY